MADTDSAAIESTALKPAESNGAGASKETPAVDPQKPPVDPEPKATADDKAKDDADDVHKRVEELEKQLKSARSEAAKNRIEKNKARADAGDVEGLTKQFEETNAALETATSQLAEKDKLIKELQKEIASEAAEILAGFQEEDKHLATGLSLAKLKALHARLYPTSNGIAPPSPFQNRTPQRAPGTPAPTTLEAYNRAKYGGK